MSESTRDLYDEIATLRQELAEAIRQRDLALAHDRQPYPTADAYEKACAALEKHRARADAAELERDALCSEVRHVVDCYRHGNLMGTVVAVDRLGEVLDGGT